MAKTRDGAGLKTNRSSPSPTTLRKSPRRMPLHTLDTELRPHRHRHTRTMGRQLGRKIPMLPLPPRRAPPSRSLSPEQKPQSPQTPKPRYCQDRRMSSRRSSPRSKAKDFVSSSSQEIIDGVVELDVEGDLESSPEVAATIPTAKKSTKAQFKTGCGGGAANGVTSTSVVTSGSPPRSKNATDKEKFKLNMSGALLSVKSIAHSSLPILRLRGCQPRRPVTRSISKSTSPSSPRRRVGGQGQGHSKSTSVSPVTSASKKSPVRAQTPSPPVFRPPSAPSSSESSEVFYSARDDSLSPQKPTPPPVQGAKDVPKTPPPPSPPTPKTSPAPPPPQVGTLSSSSTTAATTSKFEVSKTFPILTAVQYMPLLVHPPPKSPQAPLSAPSTSKSKTVPPPAPANIPQIPLQRPQGKPEPFMWHLCLLWSRKILELLELNSDDVCKHQLLTKLNIGKMMSEVVTLKYDWPYMDWREDFLMFEITEKKMKSDRAHNFGTLRVTEATHALNVSVPPNDRQWSLKFEPSTMALVEEMVRLLPTPTLVLIWGAKVSGNREIQLRGGGGGQGQGAPRVLIFRGEVPSPERMKIIQNIGNLGASELRHLSGPKVIYKRMAHRNFQDDSLAIQLSRRSAAEIERVKADEIYEMSNNGFPRGCRKVTLVATILPPQGDFFDLPGIRPGQEGGHVQGQSSRGNPPLSQSQPLRSEDIQAGVDLEGLQRKSAEVEKRMMNGFPEAVDVEVPLVTAGSQAARSKVNHDHDYVSCSQREMMRSQEMELTDDEDEERGPNQQGEDQRSGHDRVDGRKQRTTGSHSQGQDQSQDDSEEYRFTQLLNEL